MLISKSMWKLVLILLCFNSAEGDLEDFQMPKYSTALSQAIIDIVFNSFENKTTTLNIIYSSTNDNVSESLLDLINEVLYHLNGAVVELVDESKMETSKRKKKHNIIVCDTFESFEKVFRKMNSDGFELQGFFVFAISLYSDNLYEIMSRMFESLWTLQVVNVNILWMPSDNQWESLMYTYFPYTNFYCSETYPVQLNQFRDGKWLTDSEYFPEKMGNLYGCPLRVATFANAPFSIIRQNEGKFEMDGIDGILLRVLSQRMNFKVNLHVDNVNLWGDVDKTGKSTGKGDKYY